MEKGFVGEIRDRYVVDELSLLRLTTTSALGACYLAAEKINCPFVKPYDSNVETFFHYKREHHPDTQTAKSVVAELGKNTAICDTVVDVCENGQKT